MDATAPAWKPGTAPAMVNGRLNKRVCDRDVITIDDFPVRCQIAVGKACARPDRVRYRQFGAMSQPPGLKSS